MNHFSYKTDIFHCKKTSIYLFQAWTNRLVLPPQVALSFHLKFSRDLKRFYFPLSPKRLINTIKTPSEQIPDPLLYKLLDNWSHCSSCICSNPRWKEKELKATKIQLLQCIISTGIYNRSQIYLLICSEYIWQSRTKLLNNPAKMFLRQNSFYENLMVSRQAFYSDFH